MPAHHHIDNKAKLIVTTWEGDAVDKDFIETLMKYQEDILSNPDYFDYNEVVDLLIRSEICQTAIIIMNHISCISQ